MDSIGLRGRYKKWKFKIFILTLIEYKFVKNDLFMKNNIIRV